MNSSDWLLEQSALTLTRLLPRIEPLFSDANSDDWTPFERRLRREWPRLFPLLHQLYGQHYDFFYHLEALLLALARAWLERPARLKALDAAREATPDWFLHHTMVGGVIYVDLFAETLAGVRDKIPYFRELGLTYLHLMPLFAVPSGENDGGYAISDYRRVRPALGTMAELSELADALRDAGISLVVDFVFNHTADDHEWARRAKAGEPTYQHFYYMYPDRSRPDQYERTLREIFPTERRGNFTWYSDIERWLWTTFHSYQWDLNYSNPAVFRAMAEEMLFLANQGIEVLRLDAVAFIWKQLGTSCENLPEAHLIIQGYNALARIAAPALFFKSEAIVHPDEVLRYIAPHEAQISYNPLLMALLWEALATREVKLLAHSMATRWQLPDNCAWVNYLRSHDDIGWTFDDGDAHRLGIDAFGHRRFLNDFYTGKFDGSFATGVPFQANPETGDQRISGTLASLAGLEQAIERKDEAAIQRAISRIVMLHAIILSIGGIPLLYLGDEWGTVNDRRYLDDPAKADDSRWIHRPAADWPRAEQRHEPSTLTGQIYAALRRLIALRKTLPVLGGKTMTVWDGHNPHLFLYLRENEGDQLLVVANFSEQSQPLGEDVFAAFANGHTLHDLIAEERLTIEGGLRVEGYQIVWLQRGALEGGRRESKEETEPFDG